MCVCVYVSVHVCVCMLMYRVAWIWVCRDVLTNVMVYDNTHTGRINTSVHTHTHTTGALTWGCLPLRHCRSPLLCVPV